MWRHAVLETGGDANMPQQRLRSLARKAVNGQEYIDEDYCFVVWKKQPDGDYRIHVDVYSPSRKENDEN